MNIIKILLLCCWVATAAVAYEQYNNRQFRKIRQQGNRINVEEDEPINRVEESKQSSHVLKAVTEAPFLQHQQQLEKPQKYNLKKSQRVNSRRIALAEDNTIAENKMNDNVNNNNRNKNNNNKPLKRRNPKQNSPNNNNNNNNNRRPNRGPQQIVIPAELLNNFNNNNNNNNNNDGNNSLLSQLLARMRNQFSQATTLLAFPFNGLLPSSNTQTNNPEPPQQIRL